MKKKEITIKEVLIGQLSLLIFGFGILYIWKDENLISYLFEIFSIQNLERDLIVGILVLFLMESIGFLYTKTTKLKLPNNEMTQSMIDLTKKSKLNQFLMSITPGISEEILFRAAILAITVSYIGSIWGSIIVSTLFMVIHIPQYKGKKLVHVYIFSLSLFLCYAFILTGTLWSVIIIHTIHNFIAFEYLNRGITKLEELK